MLSLFMLITPYYCRFIHKICWLEPLYWTPCVVVVGLKQCTAQTAPEAFPVGLVTLAFELRHVWDCSATALNLWCAPQNFVEYEYQSIRKTSLTFLSASYFWVVLSFESPYRLTPSGSFQNQIGSFSWLNNRCCSSHCHRLAFLPPGVFPPPPFFLSARSGFSEQRCTTMYLRRWRRRRILW